MCPPKIPDPPPPLTPPTPPEESAARNLESTGERRKKQRARQPGLAGLTIPLNLPSLSLSGMGKKIGL